MLNYLFVNDLRFYLSTLCCGLTGSYYNYCYAVLSLQQIFSEIIEIELGHVILLCDASASLDLGYG